MDVQCAHGENMKMWDSSFIEERHISDAKWWNNIIRGLSMEIDADSKKKHCLPNGYILIVSNKLRRLLVRYLNTSSLDLLFIFNFEILILVRLSVNYIVNEMFA